MGVRPAKNERMTEYANERLDKMLGRIYIAWTMGILISAINLKITKVGSSGFEFEISDPTIIPGILFVICLILYIGMLGTTIMFVSQYRFANKGIIRKVLFTALGKRTTLIGRSYRDVQIIKKVARVLLNAIIVFMLFVLCMPLAHILIFEHDVLSKALLLFFS